jgi:hypothetical protein
VKVYRFRQKALKWPSVVLAAIAIAAAGRFNEKHVAIAAGSLKPSRWVYAAVGVKSEIWVPADLSAHALVRVVLYPIERLALAPTHRLTLKRDFV